MEWKQLLFILATYIGIDMIWLSSTTKALYKPGFGDLMVDNFTTFNMAMGLFSWVFLALGMMYLVKPQITDSRDTWGIAQKGAIFGLIVYGVYDTTSLATLRGFSGSMAMADLAWGTTLSALVAVLNFKRPL